MYVIYYFKTVVPRYEKIVVYTIHINIIIASEKPNPIDL